MEDKKISVERVIDLLRGAEEQRLISGDIDLIASIIWQEAEEEETEENKK